MARTATAQTPIQKAAELARTAYSGAKERQAKSDNATTQAAVAHAETKLRDAIKVENRERFENVGGGRVAKIIANIATLKNVSNRRSYEFNADDVALMFTAVRSQLTATETAFTAALQTTTEKKSAGPVAKFAFGKK